MESLDHAVRSLEITEPTPTKVPVTNYEFTFADGKSLSLDVWHTLSDTAELTASGWLFNYPRRKQTQWVAKDKVIGLLTTEGEQVYVSPEDRKRMIEDAIAKQKAKKA